MEGWDEREEMCTLIGNMVGHEHDLHDFVVGCMGLRWHVGR